MNRINILVTGGCGYIGSHTIVELLEHGYGVICVDDMRNAQKDIPKKIERLTGMKLTHYKVDVCHQQKMENIFTKHKHIDAIIHFAADKSVNESTEIPIKYYQNNITAISTLLHCVEKFHISYFVFSSSCSVYGNPKKLPVEEDTPYAEAESPYALTKQIGEMILQNYAKHKKLEVVILRYFNPAGAHPSLEIGENALHPQNLVPLIIKAGMEKKSVYIFGDNYDTRDGSCIRDFIHVCDLAVAHRLSVEHLFKKNKKAKNSAPGCTTFNIGTGKGTTVKEAIEAFEKVTNIAINKKVTARRKGDVVAIYANYTKAQKELGWEVQCSIQDIMKTAWEYAQKNNK